MQRFRASINLQFDLSDPELLDRYLLTPSHGEAFRGVLEGILGGEAHAHLLVGPYGTGKSLLATLVCQWLTSPFAADWKQGLHAQAERTDSQLADQLRRTEQPPFAFLPVTINGKLGRFRGIVNQAIYRALHRAGIPVATRNEASSILETVERWRAGYPTAYEAFLRHIEERGSSVSMWEEQIRQCAEELMRAFAAFYPTVTSGTAWSVDHETHFIEQIEPLTTELRARGVGLLVVYDEFGRFLQSLGGPDTLQQMQDLQDFAEFANRTDNLHLLLVGHKHIRQYAAQSRESVRNEFEKVEKRFRSYTLQTDSGTYLQLAQAAAADLRTDRSEGTPGNGSMVQMLKRYPLFADFTTYQLEQAVLRGLYPLHPVGVAMLPALSNVFGQNERTLFSFLADSGRYGLRDHATQETGYYYADKLFDFFDVEEADWQDQQSLQLYHTVSPYLNEKSVLERRIVRLLTLCTAARVTQKQPLQGGFIAFALGVSEEETSEALFRLAQAKIVRHNRIRDHWELYDGSAIDVVTLVAEKARAIVWKSRELCELLDSHLPVAHVLPYEYNDATDMLRYADIRFVEPAEIGRLNDGVGLPGSADYRIEFVLFRDKEQIEPPDLLVAGTETDRLTAFPTFTAESVLQALAEYKTLEQLSRDPAFLAQDSRLKNELAFLLSETGNRIRVFTSQYFRFADLKWRCGEFCLEIGSIRQLESVVSEKLGNRYEQTPVIRNELFNRHRLSNVQRRALVDVINRILRNPEADRLGIEGYGPNFLIYTSALGHHSYQFENGTVHCEGTLALIRDRLREHLNTASVGSVSSFVGLLQGVPYGIRQSVVPLLLVALLRDRWDDLHIFAHGMRIANLDGEALIELTERADEYEYRYYEWTPEEKRLLLDLASSFNVPEEEAEHFPALAAALLRWLRSLPKFTQSTGQVSAEAQLVRDIVRGTESDPYGQLKRLAPLTETLVNVKRELESFMDRNRADLEQYVTEQTGVPSMTELASMLRRFGVSEPGYTGIAIPTKLQTLPSWGENELLDRLGYAFVGVRRDDWSDATQELFLFQFAIEWQSMQAGEEAAVGRSTEQDEPVTLSKKSQTLYANVKQLLKFGGKDVPERELRQLLLNLLQEI